MERLRPVFALHACLAVLYAAAACDAAAQSRVTIAPKAGACAPAVVDEAIELESLDRFAAQTSADIKNVVAFLESSGRRLPPTIRPKVLQALSQAFDRTALNEEFRRSIRSHCEPKSFAAAIEQLKTPLGTKMRGFEDFMLTPQGRSAFFAYARNMPQHPPTAAREALLDRMEGVLHATDFLTDVNAEEARAMYIGISGKSASDAETQALREKMIPKMRQTVRANALFTYRTASDEELAQYIAMLEGAEMRRFNTILESAVENGMIRRSEVAAAMIQQIVAAVRGARRQ
jgi:hypothetical protein